MKTKNYWELSAASRMLIDYLSDKVYPSTLERLTDSFLGIDSSTQAKMVKFFIDEYFLGDLRAFTNREYTGFWHIDHLLIEMLEMIDADADEKERRDR